MRKKIGGSNMSIWEMLEIEPTKDIKQIKRAYLKAVKQYHPEEQPEAFKQINEAYQQALAYTKQKQTMPEARLIPEAEELKQVSLSEVEIETFLVYKEREIEKEKKKSYRLIIKEIKRLTDSQKIRQNTDLWNKFIRMPELQDVLMYNPFHIEARQLLVPFIDIPIAPLTQLHEMLIGELGNESPTEEMHKLLEVIRTHLRFAKQNQATFQRDDEFQKVRSWLSQYYQVINSERAKDIDGLRTFFSTSEFKEIQHHNRILEMINTYYYSQANYTKELMQVLFEVYEFKEFTYRTDWRKGHIALYRTLTQ